MDNKRIAWMDGLRGLAVVLMVLHHFLFDLCEYLGAPWVLFTNPVFDALHYLFAGVFVLLSGVSSDFSRSNLRRGARAMAVALVITAVTALMDMPIVYGVLHMLASCMLLFALTRRLWEALPAWLTPCVALAGIVLTARCAEGILTTIPHLWMFGFTTAGFVSWDYFPLLPWGFVFLLGTWCGRYVKAGRLPAWTDRVQAGPLAAVGRHALAVYVAHQPVLYALTLALKWLLGR